MRENYTVIYLDIGDRMGELSIKFKLHLNVGRILLSTQFRHLQYLKQQSYNFVIPIEEICTILSVEAPHIYQYE